jgi:hypothetical protein
MEHITPRNVTSGSTAGNGDFFAVRVDSYGMPTCEIVNIGSMYYINLPW